MFLAQGPCYFITAILIYLVGVKSGPGVQVSRNKASVSLVAHFLVVLIVFYLRPADTEVY